MDKIVMLTLFCLIVMVESTKNIFILAGQSNMVGEGGAIINKTWDGFIPPECEATPLILRLNTELDWEEAHEPLHKGIASAPYCGVGPGMPFAHSVLTGMAEIALVPCASEGTSISQWMRGTDLYNRALARAQAAVSNGGGAIHAILWYQGEADTYSQLNAELYKGLLEQFLTDFRSDLQLPLLPVIQVALASGNLTGLETVRKAQLEMKLPNVSCVDAKGLELEPDGTHLTTAAQVQLGKMMAHNYFQMIST